MSSEINSSTTETKTSEEIKISSTGTQVLKVQPARTLRKRTSLKPRKSLLKVKSFRPTRAMIGKID